MISSVSLAAYDFASIPHRFEAGTPNLAGAVGMAAASQWLEKQGWSEIREREHRLTEVLSAGFAARKYSTLLAPAPDIPLFSFVVQGIHAHDLGTLLDFEGFSLRSGHHCVAPLHHILEIEASTRASLSFQNSTEECEHFFDVLDEIHERFVPMFQEED